METVVEHQSPFKCEIFLVQDLQAVLIYLGIVLLLLLLLRCDREAAERRLESTRRVSIQFIRAISRRARRKTRKDEDAEDAAVSMRALEERLRGADA